MYPKEYIDYLVHFHGDRDYFECHEILEEYWKTVDKNNKESILVGLIQLAVSNYHHRRKNFRGALRTLQKAVNIFHIHESSLGNYGLSAGELFAVLDQRREMIENQEDYVSMNLPIQDQGLLSLCQNACREKGFTWGEKSDLYNETLIHRHSKRDRTDVILERHLALERRQKKGRE